MTTKFANVAVVIDDPDGRFESDKEVTVQLTYNSAENVFNVKVPEAKRVSNEPKPQPTKCFDGTLSGIKGTVTVKGNLKVGMDIPPAKAKAIGKSSLAADLRDALAATWDEVFSKDPS